jgi:uncharacterized repeat protein (TIGR01451 family)
VPGVFAALRGRVARCAPLLLLCLLAAPRAHALGTPAGTVIANTADVTFNIGAGTATLSATAQFTVDELVAVNVTWQDVAPVAVAPADVDRVLAFLVTNTGNGPESFALALDPALGGDQFDPANVRIYLDTNGSTVYEPGVDPLYVPGVNDPLLAADAALWIFALADIPPALANGDRGDADLSASSLTGVVPGAIFAGAGDGGGDAVIGAGSAGALGSYVVADVFVSIAKSAVVSDPGGGSVAGPGSTITYTLVVTTTGTGNVDNLVITDPLPPFTSWVAGSLALNAAGLSDAADADAGDFGGTTPNQVTVALGNVAGGSLPQTITFAVTID